MAAETLVFQGMTVMASSEQQESAAAANTSLGSDKEWRRGACAALGIDPQTPFDQMHAKMTLLHELRRVASRMAAEQRLEVRVSCVIERAKNSAFGVYVPNEDGLLKSLKKADEIVQALARLDGDLTP